MSRAILTSAVAATPVVPTSRVAGRLPALKGVLNRLLFWRADGATDNPEAADPADAGFASAVADPPEWRIVEEEDPPKPPLVGEQLDDLIYAALMDHTRQLKREIDEQLRKHLTEVESRMLSQVEGLCVAARESNDTALTALSCLRSEFDEFRQNVVLRFGNIEKIGDGINGSLTRVEGHTDELVDLCQSQSMRYEDQLKVTRESLAALQQSSDKRIRDLGAHHSEKDALVKAEQERRRQEQEKIQRSYSERLHGYSGQLEQLATRLQLNSGKSEGPALEIDNTGHHLWRWITTPLRKINHYRSAARQLEELQKSVQFDGEELLAVRNHLQSFSSEVRRGENAGPGNGQERPTRNFEKFSRVSRGKDLQKVC